MAERYEKKRWGLGKEFLKRSILKTCSPRLQQKLRCFY